MANESDSTYININVIETTSGDPVSDATFSYSTNLGVLRSSESVTDDEGNTRELTPGTFIYIPAGGNHNVKNTSDMPLQFVFIITKSEFSSKLEE